VAETVEPDRASASFAEFVESSRDRLLRALAAHHGPEVGRDALADAYSHAWSNWPRVSAMGNPVGFVFRVADRMGARRASRARREQPSDVVVLAPEWFDTERDVDTIAALRALPPRQRAAVLMVHGWGWSYKHTAETLDVPVSTITNDVHRGVARLRELLESHP
jgi:DNA-directed RNA polymerase specialized sigma24 family protein